MIWIVGYSKNDKLEKSRAVDAYAVTGNEFNMQAKHTMQTVYENNTEYYVYVDALVKTEALVKAQRIFKEYFKSLAEGAEECISLKIDEVKEFVVGDTVKVVGPDEQFTTHFEAMGGLLDNAFDFGYRGEFTVGGNIRKYDLKTTTFTVIGKGKFDANGQENMTLYMIAESVNAEQHDWHKGIDKTREPLEVFVLCKEGLERW